MQYPSLGKEHQVIRHFLCDSMLENICQIWRLRLDQHQAQTGQSRHTIGQSRLIRFDWVDCLKDAEREDTPDHAGDFECQLLGWVEAVDAVRDGSLQGIGERKILKIQ